MPCASKFCAWQVCSLLKRATRASISRRLSVSIVGLLPLELIVCRWKYVRHSLIIAAVGLQGTSTQRHLHESDVVAGTEHAVRARGPAGPGRAARRGGRTGADLRLRADDSARQGRAPPH